MKMLAIVLILLGAGAARADCDSGQPCGPVPWLLPVLPPLASPTLVPSPTVVNMSGLVFPTPTPQPGGGLSFNTGDLDNHVATLQAMAAGTPIAVANVFGAYESTQDTTYLPAQSATFFSYTKGLATANFGVLTPLVSLLLFAVAWMLMVRLANIMAPIIAALIGFARKVIQLILDFIPG